MRKLGHIDASRIARFINPRSVAVIGASESSPRHAVRALLDSGLEVHFVNPNRDSVFGQKTAASLAAIEGEVDAVLTLVNAKVAVDVVEQAAKLGVGGVAINAAGFGEIGGEGIELQKRLVAAAGDMPVLGPNCNGFVTVPTGAFLAGAPKLPLRAGGVGMITHSGGFITDVAVSAVDRQVGFSSLISTGNEAVTDMVDYLNYLVDDPMTKVITLVVEGIKRPDEFFAAVARARAAGKPVIALKLGRSERGREVAKSHTGSILGEGWVYDAAFRQHGVIAARDLDDLIDRSMLFDQLPVEKWSAAARTAVLTVSGGSASLASDVAEAEGMPLEPMDSLTEGVTELLPGAGTMNPIDLTGFVMGKPELIRSIVDCYIDSPEVDSIVALWTLGVESEGFAKSFTQPFADAAAASDKPIVLSAVAAARVSPWAQDLRGDALAIGHGIRGTMRGLSAMAEFSAFEGAPAEQATKAARVDRPQDIIETDDGTMVRFGEAMRLFESAGIPISPFVVIGEGEDASSASIPFSGPFVVKIADCPHRSDIGGVRVGVQGDELLATIDELRLIAAQHSYPGDVAVQPLVRGDGELFIGGKADGELGPMVVAGLGGIYVEALGAVSGRIAPISSRDAGDVLTEIDRLGNFAGNRGQRPWDRDSAVQAVLSVAELVDGASDWMQSLDINPLLNTEQGFMAVDALIYLR